MQFDMLPTDFESLVAVIPDGIVTSERVITPLIIIERAISKEITARLGGYRIINGKKQIYYAPTNRHSWVLDNNIIRPLPIDSASLFSRTINGADEKNLKYSFALSLLSSTKCDILTEAKDDFFKTGASVSVDMDEKSVPGLKATLFPYQAKGISWMHETLIHTGGLILADEMGLGKTIQIISLLLLNKPTSDKPCLIVCPTSLIANWTREITKFTDELSFNVHRGPSRAGVYKDLLCANVIITTYETMVNDISLLSAIEWSWLIADEAQAIKNPLSNRRKAIITIPRLRTIPMTGTPVENSLLDLWSLADFAIPGLLGSQHDFESMYSDSLESAKTIGQFTDPVILRRRVSDVATDLPDRIDIDVPVELDARLVDHYIAVREETLAKYPVAGALVATLQLQLVCAHPWLRYDDSDLDNLENANISAADSSELVTPKVARTLLLLEEAFRNGRKVLIFSIFNKIGDLLNQALPADPDRYWNAINGSTPQNSRQQIVDDFTSHNGAACLVLNPKAAGSGLNITAATIVIHFTPVWNPAIEAQASARAHRRGQIEPVTIYKLFYIDTVEEVMIDRANWKKELAHETIPVSTRDSTDLKRALQIFPSRPK
jgi:SNF2 family DNA or RNA helicase